MHEVHFTYSNQRTESEGPPNEVSGLSDNQIQKSTRNVLSSPPFVWASEKVLYLQWRFYNVLEHSWP